MKNLISNNLSFSKFTRLLNDGNIYIVVLFYLAKMNINTESVGLDQLFDESKRYLGKGLKPLNPGNVIGSPLNDTSEVFTAQGWLEGLIGKLSKTGIAIMIHHDDEQKGYDFLDRVVKY
jgi:hypothetical protein